MRAFIYIAYLVLVITIGFAGSGNLNTSFIILTILLLGYNIMELVLLKRRQPLYFFINPIVIGAFFTFLLAGGGLSNFFVMEDGEFILRNIGFALQGEREWLNIALSITCIASMCTWIGYRSNLGVTLFSWITKRIGMARFYAAEISLNKVVALVIIAYLIKFFLFSQGLFGRLVSSEYFDAGSGYKRGSEIRVLASLSYLTFILVCLQYFQKKTPMIFALFWGSLVLEIIFGFVYGARGPFILPFIIMFVTRYYVSKKIKIGYVLLGLCALLFAVTIVLDFKNYVLSSEFIAVSSPVETLNNFINYNESRPELSNDEYAENAANGLDFSVIPEAAISIRHKTLNGLGPDDPGFLSSIFLFPFNAFVPKFIQGSNEFTWGMWFKNNVLGYQQELKYSITMTPVGFLYFSGGILMVVIGFFIYGILLRMAYEYLFLGILGFITFMSVLNHLQNFDSIVSSTLVNVTREVFIFPIIFFFLLRTSKAK